MITGVEHRIRYLDSLRGLAALQVLLLHFFSAFVPALVKTPLSGEGLACYIHESPLFWLYDGSSAVYLFFILSGYVLTPAFSTPGARIRGLVGSRIVRLLVPAFAACGLSALMAIPLGGAHERVGMMLQSDWLQRSWSPLPGLAFFLKDSLLNSIVIGYQGTSTLWAVNLFKNAVDTTEVAYVGPLWSLSIELQGSLLVLLLVWIRKRSPIPWAIASVLVFVMFLRSHFYLFIVGHVLAVFAFAERRRIPNGIAIALMVVGIALCVREEAHELPIFTHLCEAGSYLSFPCMPHPQKVFGAALVFVGMLQATRIKKLLGRPLLLTLGDLSFPIYLVHWPVIFGVAATLLQRMTPTLGASMAVAIAVVFGIAVTLLVAKGFSSVDRVAIAASRGIRRAL